MGPDRFKCVLSVARSLLIQEGYIASGRLPESVDRPVPLSTDPRVAQAVVRRSAVLDSAGKSPCSSPVRARASAASGDKSVQRRVHSSLATTDDQKETNSAAKTQYDEATKTNNKYVWRGARPRVSALDPSKLSVVTETLPKCKTQKTDCVCVCLCV